MTTSSFDTGSSFSTSRFFFEKSLRQRRSWHQKRLRTSGFDLQTDPSLLSRYLFVRKRHRVAEILIPQRLTRRSERCHVAFQMRKIHVQALQRDESLIRTCTSLVLGEERIAKSGGHALAKLLILAVIVHVWFHCLAHLFGNAADILNPSVDFEIVNELGEESVADFEEHVDRFVRCAHPELEMPLSRGGVADGVS